MVMRLMLDGKDGRRETRHKRFATCHAQSTTQPTDSQLITITCNELQIIILRYHTDVGVSVEIYHSIIHELTPRHAFYTPRNNRSSKH